MESQRSWRHCSCATVAQQKCWHYLIITVMLLILIPQFTNALPISQNSQFSSQNKRQILHRIPLNPTYETTTTTTEVCIQIQIYATLFSINVKDIKCNERKIQSSKVQNCTLILSLHFYFFIVHHPSLIYLVSFDRIWYYLKTSEFNKKQLLCQNENICIFLRFGHFSFINQFSKK